MQVLQESAAGVSPSMHSKAPESGQSQQDYAIVSNTKEQFDIATQAIERWLLNKYALTKSRCTAATYREILTSLRAYLLAQGLDLNSPGPDIASHIQIWAGRRSSSRERRGSVAPSTYNQRIAAVSSFYQWAIESGIYKGENPTRQLSRIPVQKYAKSRALNPRQVGVKLKDIDQTTLRGLRDYTLLQVALNTGRSAQELASLTRGCVHIENEIVTLIFARCKGGKTLYDTLDARLSKIVSHYLRAVYGPQLETVEPLAPVWVSLSDRNYKQGIGPQTIADICESCLGVSTVQTLRHTFTIAMAQQGAGTHTIQERLGRASVIDTDKYLSRLKEASNLSYV